MGMYTKVSFIIPIKHETPKEIKDILVALIEDDLEKNQNLPNHPFFETARYSYFAQCNSFYFTGTSNSSIQYPYRHWRDYELKDDIVLHIDSDSKHYDNEIPLFLDWVKSYMEKPKSGFIGYTFYEEDERPTLWFLKDGKIVAEYNEKGDLG